MFLVCKFREYKRNQKEKDKRKSTEKELSHLNHKIDKLLIRLEEHETETASNPDEECVICINAKATMQTFPCGHRVVCRRCFVKTIQMAVSERILPLRCVVCRAKIFKLKQTSHGGIVPGSILRKHQLAPVAPAPPPGPTRCFGSRSPSTMSLSSAVSSTTDTLFSFPSSISLVSSTESDASSLCSKGQLDPVPVYPFNGSQPSYPIQSHISRGECTHSEPECILPQMDPSEKTPLMAPSPSPSLTSSSSIVSAGMFVCKRHQRGRRRHVHYDHCHRYRNCYFGLQSIEESDEYKIFGTDSPSRSSVQSVSIDTSTSILTTEEDLECPEPDLVPTPDSLGSSLSRSPSSSSPTSSLMSTLSRDPISRNKQHDRNIDDIEILESKEMTNSFDDEKEDKRSCFSDGASMDATTNLVKPKGKKGHGFKLKISLRNLVTRNRHSLVEP